MAEKKQLTKFAREQLGHYVYALRNPIDKTIFYVGKGKGDRVLAHASGPSSDIAAVISTESAPNLFTTCC
jgi:hypothetical protein